MKSTLVAIVIACIACGTSQTNDAGADGACTGSKPTCCQSCLDDVLIQPVCASDGAWACPYGSFTQLDCIGQCTKYCNAGELVCPSGSYDTAIEDGGACAVDASAD